MIEINNLSGYYGKKRILNYISFQAETGTCVGILGQNGSGKSTMLSVLAGTLPGGSGEFLYDGTDLFKDDMLPA